MTLLWHLSKAVLIRIFAVLVGLGGLAMALDLVEMASTVLAAGEGGIARYLMLRAPLILLAVAPVALVVGPVLTFLTLSARSEFTIYRAAGMTTYRMLIMLVPLGAAIGIGLYHMQDSVAPKLENELLGWLETQEAHTAGGFWAHTATGVVQVDASTPRGRMLVDVDIYQTDERGLMTARIAAKVARYREGEWVLNGATRLVPGAAAEDISGAVWKTSLTPANVRALAAPSRTVAGKVAGRVLDGEWAGNRTEDYYLMRVLRGYAAALTPLLMFLIAAPAAFGMRRSPGFGRGAIWAVALGFGFLLIDGMLASLGETGAVPPYLAAFGATAFFAAIGMWRLVALEEEP